MNITRLHAREILDSRANPTVEVEVSTKFLGRVITARESVPSGASVGTHEAVELRDKETRYHGKGVLNACANVNTKIAKKVVGMNPTFQEEIDQTLIELDGTGNKSSLGANATLGVSLACAKLAAQVREIPLYEHISELYEHAGKFRKRIPIPFCNIINGGVHADTHLSFQEFMLVPFGKSYRDSIRMVSEVYHELKSLIAKKYGKVATHVGDEGGFAPDIKSNKDALELLSKATEETGYKRKIAFAMDAAASEFYTEKRNVAKYFVDGKFISASKLQDYYNELVGQYKVVSIEDPFAQDNFDEWASFKESRKRSRLQIVGDDLLCTNVHRMEQALHHKACNALLLKMNQIGTVTESLEAARQSFNYKWHTMVSHRSGETEDSFIADLAIGIGSGQIKTGAPARGERTAKHNQLMRIEEELKGARYAGKSGKI